MEKNPDQIVRSYRIASRIRLGIALLVFLPLSCVIGFYSAAGVMLMIPQSTETLVWLDVALLLCIPCLVFAVCFIYGTRLLFATLRCVVCRSRPGNLFDQGGKCQSCQAILIDDPLYRTREIAVAASPEEKARIEKSFLIQTRKRIFYGRTMVALLFLSMIFSLIFNTESIFYVGMLLVLFIAFSAFRDRKKIACPGCGENPYLRQNSKSPPQLRFGCCSRCGAQLIRRRRIFKLI